MRTTIAQLLLLPCLLTFTECNSTGTVETGSSEPYDSTSKSHQRDTPLHFTKDTVTIDPVADTIEIIVVQCANGYGYSGGGFDFNPVIEGELNEFKTIVVKPFPLFDLMGVSYQGVFDKKYCPPIIEKVNADILILTRFDKDFMELEASGLNGGKMEWGYEIRIVDTRTLEQINSIYAHNLDGYQEIVKHIQDNIQQLKQDIESLNKNSLQH